MTVKKAMRNIHLWLGLASGLIVFILGITGAILAFEWELRAVLEPYRTVNVQETPVRSPLALKTIAQRHMASGKVLGIEYPSQDKAAVASYFDADHYEILYLNPYTGVVLKHKNMNRDFFRIILNGHYYLWLPEEIGQPIAATATLIFVVLMITGIILWWPKNRAAAGRRFSIRWNARWRRVNFDVHAVVGFYLTWIASIIALTGLVFGFQWVAKSVYWISSGGVPMEDHAHPLSDTTTAPASAALPDALWAKHQQALVPGEGIAVWFASLPTDPIEVVINHRYGTYYTADFYHYDQFTGQQLHARGSWDGRFSDAEIADKIARMNYDIHVGAILGLPGKIIAFLVSLLAASLPVTGFLLWLGRKIKKSGTAPVPRTDTLAKH
jgi:uncharacterized iron-regulated membrane protein